MYIDILQIITVVMHITMLRLNMSTQGRKCGGGGGSGSRSKNINCLKRCDFYSKTEKCFSLDRTR